jgi:hypothetical protein
MPCLSSPMGTWEIFFLTKLVTVFWEHPIPWNSKRKEFRTEKWVAIDSTDRFSFQFKIMCLFLFLVLRTGPVHLRQS